MTSRAFRKDMFSIKIKSDLVMIKVRTMRIDAIMTGHAVCAKCQEVLGGKGLIHLQVTISARRLIERCGITIYMTVLTGESRTVCLCLMGSQFE